MVQMKKNGKPKRNNTDIHIEHTVTVNLQEDQTSRRSSYLAFEPVQYVWFLCLPFPFSVAMIDGDGGNLSIIDERGESSSSSSSSLVYPFLCTEDRFLNKWDLPPASATFSATSEEDGGLYSTGAAVYGKLLAESPDNLRSIML